MIKTILGTVLGVMVAVAASKHSLDYSCVWDTCGDGHPCEPGSECVSKGGWSRCEETPEKISDCIVSNNGFIQGKSYGCESDADCCNSNAICVKDSHAEKGLCELPCNTVSEPSICQADCNEDGVCLFHVILDVFASATGYFKIEECGDVSSPTLQIDIGKEYRFMQNDPTNWFHPIGLAYAPDGALDDVNELEPGIALGSDTSCAETFTCLAPQYFVKNAYVGGDYQTLTAPFTGGDNFGLDDYEPTFAIGRDDWLDIGEFYVAVKIWDAATIPAADIFYFCHIHKGMSGRIKVFNPATNSFVSDADYPIGKYPMPNLVPIEPFDKKCGTANCAPYGKDGAQMCAFDFLCPSTITYAGSDPAEVAEFGECMQSLDCKMHTEMRTVNDNNPVGGAVATFNRQMIPHHENAVNMAKALLTQPAPFGMNCPDKGGDASLDCEMYTIVWDIINTQNAQIVVMRKWLEEYGVESSVFPYEGECLDAPTVPYLDKASDSNSDGNHSELGSLDLISGLVGMTVGAALMTILIAAGYYSYWLKTGKGIRNLSTLKHDSSKFVESIVADYDNEVSVVVL